MILALFWLFAIIAIWLPLRVIVYGLLISISFGTLAVVPLEISGGVTFLPVTVLSSVVIVRLILKSDVAAVVDAALNWRHLGLLMAFLVYAILITAIAPIVFAGVPTMGLNIQQFTPLAPGAGNITQGLYLANSCLMTLATFLLLSEEDGRQLFRKALIIGGSAVVVTGIADMATYGSAALSEFRTASYTLLSNSDMAGVRRVVGLQPEASAFGYVALSFGSLITFMRPAETLDRRWRWLAALAGWSCLLMAALSTSSGAIAGLVVFLVIMVCDTIVLLLRGQGGAATGRLRGNLGVLIGLVVVAGLVLTVLPDVASQLAKVFDAAVVRKASTSSFEERLYWNTVSLDGLRATGGFGLGVGSTRASSWFVALACGTGVIGSALLGLFVMRAVFQPVGRAHFADRLLIGGAKRTLLVSLLPFAGSATSVDFGLLIAFVFAVLTAIPANSAQSRVLAESRVAPARHRSMSIARAHRLTNR
jgi:hypothetical protein